MKTFIKIFLFVAAAGGLYWFAFYQTPQEKEFARTLAAARQGDATAMERVADFYAAGEGTKPNAAQAVEWYKNAAQKENNTAAWKLAQLYIEGKEIPQNLEQAANYVELAAQGGVAAAQNELGRFYREGLGGITAHAGQGFFWRFTAAQQGNKAAQQYLEQAQKDEPELFAKEAAFFTDLKSAENGNGEAQVRVAQAYRAGEVVLPDVTQAENWLLQAWQANKLPQAGYELSQLYLDKTQPLYNEGKGVALLGELAQLPYAPAQYVLGERAYKEEPANYKDAFAWFSNAAAAGYAPAQYMTGFMLMQGQGMTKSEELSIKFFRDAAEQNYASAQYVLGQIYYKGLGVPRDEKAGKMWLEKAAQNGSAPAQALLQTFN